MLKNADLGLDIGNSKFSLCVRGEGVVASESSYIAYRGDYLTESAVVAFGDDAKSMYERAHPGISVVTPMSEGVIVDCQIASLILKLMVKRAGIRWRLAKPKVVVGALYGASDVERKAFVDVAESLGCRRPSAVFEPLAAANGLDMDLSEPYANMIVDVGDGATEAIVVSLGRTVMGSSMRFGGADLDTLIVEYVRKHHDLVISRSQARRLKEDLSVLSKNDGHRQQLISVKGIGVEGFLPRERQILVTDILVVMERFADKIAEFVLNFLSRVPPEVSVDLIENGIYLCGGVSQSALVHERISAATNLKINSVSNPDKTVIRGIERMLEFSRYIS